MQELEAFGSDRGGFLRRRRRSPQALLACAGAVVALLGAGCALGDGSDPDSVSTTPGSDSSATGSSPDDGEPLKVGRALETAFAPLGKATDVWLYHSAPGELSAAGDLELADGSTAHIRGSIRTPRTGVQYIGGIYKPGSCDGVGGLYDCDLHDDGSLSVLQAIGSARVAAVIYPDGFNVTIHLDTPNDVSLEALESIARDPAWARVELPE